MVTVPEVDPARRICPVAPPLAPMVMSSTNEGELLNTSKPEPVSSVTDKETLAEEMEVVNCPPVVVETRRSAVRAEKVVVPEELKVVKLPVEGVVAPMAVELMPVAVVLKLEEVMVRALAPVLIEEADRPERAKAPEVAVRLRAPVVKVRPLEAVRVPAEVIVPVPVVEILPGVVMFPEAKVIPVAPVMAPADEISILVVCNEKVPEPPPMVTKPVDVPVLMLVALLVLLLIDTVPVTSRPPVP